MLKLKVILTAAVVGGFVVFTPQTASASPLAMGAGKQSPTAALSLVETVGYRYRRWGHRRYGYGYRRYRHYGYGYHRRYYGGYWPYYGGGYGYGYPYYGGYGYGGYCPPYGGSYLSFGFGY